MLADKVFNSVGMKKQCSIKGRPSPSLITDYFPECALELRSDSGCISLWLDCSTLMKMKCKCTKDVHSFLSNVCIKFLKKKSHAMQ